MLLYQSEYTQEMQHIFKIFSHFAFVTQYFCMMGQVV